LSFNLSHSGRSFFGERQAESLKGNIWEAGKDEKFVILGVSFSGPKRVWRNSIHYVDPDGKAETRIARGVVFRTRPILRAGRPSAFGNS
jgi:hypothetical protein